MRVLAVIPAGSSNASMVFARRQVDSLRQAGVLCETFLLASRTSPRILFREWRRLREAVRSFRPDIVHAHYGTVTALVSTFSGCNNVIVTFRGSDLNPEAGARWPLRLARTIISQYAALRATRVICVSEQLRQRLWRKPSRAAVIPSGVDINVFYPQDRGRARAELGWGDGDAVVLFNAGANPQQKRLDLAQASVDLTRRIHGEIRLVVLNGEVPPQSIPLMMCAADCLLVTSDFEGSPNVVKEAMACNLPVVSVDVGDVRQRLSGVAPSFVVNRDAGVIAQSLANILRHRQRSNGRSKIEPLSSSAIAAQLIQAYEAVWQQTSGDQTSTATAKLLEGAKG